MGDERTQAAISHWAPRFVSNGVPLHDFETVTRAVPSWREWCAHWVERGRMHERLGDDAIAAGHTVAAGEHLRHAALCYHFGKFVFVEWPDEMRAAHELAVAAYGRAVRHLDPPGERVAIPYEGTALAGILRIPNGAERPPVVLMVSGLDSTKEEMDAYEQHFHRRGLATLAFDGPGQGEAEYDLPMRADFEKPVAAVIDYLEGRDEVADRVGIFGVSLGGHYVVRATAFEPRIAACASISGSYCLAEHWEGRPQQTRASYRRRAHLASDEETAAFVRTLDLDGVAARVSVPFYVVAGTADRLTPYTAGIRMAEEATGPTVLDVIEGGNHVVNNMPYRYRPQVADWMNDVLRTSPSRGDAT